MVGPLTVPHGVQNHTSWNRTLVSVRSADERDRPRSAITARRTRTRDTALKQRPGFPRSDQDRLRFSCHALKRMGEQGITQEMVETVLACGRWFEGDTANEYEATVRGRLIHVTLSAGPRPGIVITVYWVVR